MEKYDSKFNWCEVLNLNGKGAKHNLFDEGIIYKAIRKKNFENNLKNIKVYSLSLKYTTEVNRFYYAEILTKFFNISPQYLAEHIYKLESDGQLSWNNLSQSFTDLIVEEINRYLSQKNIQARIIIIKKVEEDAIKKPGNDFA